MRIGENPQGNSDDIAAIIETLRRAGRATEQGDPDGTIAMFDQGKDVVLFDYMVPDATTVDDVKKTVQALRATVPVR